MAKKLGIINIIEDPNDLDEPEEENWLHMNAILSNKRHAKAVKRSLNKFMHEEVGAAHERAIIRLAYKFKFLLSPHQQKILTTQYPESEINTLRAAV